jgi:hypothetical protein
VGENQRNKVRYVVAAIAEFSRYAKLSPQLGYRYLADHGGVRFLDEHYEAEHLLSFEDVTQDLVRVAAMAGGGIR